MLLWETKHKILSAAAVRGGFFICPGTVCGIRPCVSVGQKFQRSCFNNERKSRNPDPPQGTIAYIQSTGLHCFVGPCETAVEGDFDTIMEIAKQCHLVAIKAGAPSVSSYLKISYRPEGEVLTIDKKTSKYHQ